MNLTTSEVRTRLEQMYGHVMTTDQATDEYEFQYFAAPLVVVKRKLDGVRGTLTFVHFPRFYHSFKEE